MYVTEDPAESKRRTQDLKQAVCPGRLLTAQGMGHIRLPALAGGRVRRLEARTPISPGAFCQETPGRTEGSGSTLEFREWIERDGSPGNQPACPRPSGSTPVEGSTPSRAAEGLAVGWEAMDRISQGKGQKTSWGQQRRKTRPDSASAQTAAENAAWTGPLAYAGARRAAVSPMSGRLPGMGRRGAAAGPRAGPPRTGAAGSLSWETGRDGGWENCPRGGTDSPWELKGRARTCEGVGLGCVGCGAGALLLTA